MDTISLATGESQNSYEFDTKVKSRRLKNWDFIGAQRIDIVSLNTEIYNQHQDAFKMKQVDINIVSISGYH